MAHMWLRMAETASKALRAPNLTDADKNFYISKLQTAEFFFDRIFPRIKSLAQTMIAPTKSLMQMKSDNFDHY
jgi:hypothetical protein